MKDNPGYSLQNKLMIELKNEYEQIGKITLSSFPFLDISLFEDDSVAVQPNPSYDQGTGSSVAVQPNPSYDQGTGSSVAVQPNPSYDQGTVAIQPNNQGTHSMFMEPVSEEDQLYQQMKGVGIRSIKRDKLR